LPEQYVLQEMVANGIALQQRQYVEMFFKLYHLGYLFEYFDYDRLNA